MSEVVAAGVEAASLGDLINSKARYAAAMPTLITWLPRVHERRVRLRLIMAIGRPWAGLAALDALIEEFRAPHDRSQLWQVGDAISYLWTDRRYHELVELAIDPAYGSGREMVVYGMRKSKRPEAVEVLLGLLNDREVSGHATEALVALQDPRARPGLEQMTHDDREWVRDKARAGLARLEGAGARSSDERGR